jgi:hypothetical protein
MTLTVWLTASLPGPVLVGLVQVGLVLVAEVPAGRALRCGPADGATQPARLHWWGGMAVLAMEARAAAQASVTGRIAPDSPTVLRLWSEPDRAAPGAGASRRHCRRGGPPGLRLEVLALDVLALGVLAPHVLVPVGRARRRQEPLAPRQAQPAQEQSVREQPVRA